MAVVYSIYINYFNRNGSCVTTETKMYDVPAGVNNENILLEPKVKGEMGKAGSFEFSMYYGHPYYNCWNQMRTTMRVEYFGETIFYGRVLTIDVDHITSKKTIHCEGALAFLIDSYIQGKPDKDRTKIAPNAYINQLINTHNTQMANGRAVLSTPNIPKKTFAVGMVPGHYSGADSNQQIKMEDETIKFGTNSWQTTADAFSSLIKEYGGYLRTRYVSEDTIYLDWLDAYFRPNASGRVIEVSNNVISLSSNAEVDNIFTVLIPIGKNSSDSESSDEVLLTPKELYVKDITSVYTDAQLNVGYHNKSDYTSSLNKYGVICKVQNFSNADTVEKLRTWAWDWIKNNYHGGLSSFSATALDLKITGGSDALIVGDQVAVRYPVENDNGAVTMEQKVLTILSAEYNLHKPEANTYSIGIPDNALNKTYGESSNSSKSKASSKAGKAKAKAGGGGGKGDDDGDDIKKKVDHFFYAHVLNSSYENPDYAEYKRQYGDEAADSILRSTRLLLDQGVDEEGTPTAVKNAKQKLKTLILDGQNGTLTGFKPVTNLGVFNEKNNEWMSDYYATQASLTLDTFRNSLTLREQVENIMDWTRDDFLNKPRPKAVLEMAMKQFEAQQNAKSQYGSIATRFSTRGQADTVTSENTTTVINGYNGQFVGGKLQLSGFGLPNLPNLPTIEQLGGDLTGTLKGVFGLDGNTGTMGIINPSVLNQSGSSSPENILVEGAGTGGEGSIKAGYDNVKERFRTWLNKENEYKDAEGHTVKTKGFIDAEDYTIKDYMPSLKTDLLVVDTLLADYAQIDTLAAMNASIQELWADHVTTAKIEAIEGDIATLNTDKLTTTSLSAAISALKLVSVDQLSASSSIGTSGVISCKTLSVSTKNMNVCDAKISKDGLTLEIDLVTGGPVLFSKATTLSGKWSGSDSVTTATFTVSADPKTAEDISTSITLKIDKDNAWVLDPDNNTISKIANVYDPRYFKSDNIAPIGDPHVPHKETGTKIGTKHTPVYHSGVNRGQGITPSHKTGKKLGGAITGVRKRGTPWNKSTYPLYYQYKSGGSIYYAKVTDDLYYDGGELTGAYSAGSDYSHYDVGTSEKVYKSGTDYGYYDVGTDKDVYEAGDPYEYYDVGTQNTVYEAGTTVTRYELLSSSTGATHTYYFPKS